MEWSGLLLGRGLCVPFGPTFLAWLFCVCISLLNLMPPCSIFSGIDLTNIVKLVPSLSPENSHAEKHAILQVSYMSCPVQERLKNLGRALLHPPKGPLSTLAHFHTMVSLDAPGKLKDRAVKTVTSLQNDYSERDFLWTWGDSFCYG